MLAALPLRTMQVVGSEHGLAASVDVLAGSAKLADVDDHVYTEVTRWELDAILEQGGAVATRLNGYIRQADRRRPRHPRGAAATGANGPGSGSTSSRRPPAP